MGLFSRNNPVKEMKQLLKQCNPKISDGLMYSDNTIKKLAEVLLPNEKIEYAVRDITVLGVCTDKRFICITYKSSFSTDVADISYSKISSVKIDSGIGNDELEIFMSGNKIKVKYTGKERAKEMYTYLQGKLLQADKNNCAPQSSNGTTENKIDQLERLAKLKEQGILTEQEFALQKQLILSSTSQSCPNCGAITQPDWNFCVSCSKPL